MGQSRVRKCSFARGEHRVCLSSARHEHPGEVDVADVATFPVAGRPGQFSCSVGRMSSSACDSAGCAGRANALLTKHLMSRARSEQVSAYEKADLIHPLNLHPHPHPDVGVDNMERGSSNIARDGRRESV